MSDWSGNPYFAAGRATRSPGGVMSASELYLALLELHAPMQADEDTYECSECSDPGNFLLNQIYPCRTVRALERHGVYSAHSGSIVRSGKGSTEVCPECGETVFSEGRHGTYDAEGSRVVCRGS